MKKTFSKSSRLLAMVGLFALVLGTLLVPLSQAKADVVLVTGSIVASPGSVCSGQSTTLTWSSTDATSVDIEPGIGSVSAYGQRSVSPTQTTTYTMTLSNSTGGYGQTTVTVTVTGSCNSNPGTDAPTVSITADDTRVDSGDDTTVRWDSDNATSCTASGATHGWAGSRATSGSFNTGDLENDETYSITCRNSDGDTATDSVTVRVDDNDNNGDEPTVTISADDTSIDSGDSTIVRWDSEDADSCRASGGTNGWSGSRNESGSFNTGRLTDDVTYRITCSNDNGDDDDSVTVHVGSGNGFVSNNRPTVATDYATNLTGYSATLNGRVNGNGLNTTAWFTYGTNTNFGYSTVPNTYGAGFTNFSAPIFGLSPNTTYYFRAVAQNSEGIAYGDTLSFRTVTTGSATTIVTTRNTNTSNSLVLINSSIDRNQPIVPTIDNSRPHPGDEINYTVTYQNVGNASISNLTLRLDLPQEVDYMFSTPANPTHSGNTLIFNLGTLRANGTGTVSVRVRVRDNIADGTNLDFPATLSYIDPSGNPQSVSANVSAEVLDSSLFGANAFWSGSSFLPSNIFGWLLLIILIVILVLLARYLLFPPDREIHTTTIEH